MLSTLTALLVLSMTAAPEEVTLSPAPRDSLRLGLMRGVPQKWNLEANFSVFLERLAQADEQGADVFLTPECWLDGYAAPDPESTRERLRGVAQDLHHSPYLQRVAEEAKAREMMICFGFTSLEGERIYNAAGLWGPDGRLIGLYRKTHIQTHDHQFDYGTALSAWNTPWGVMGVVICADRRWPESMRTLRLQGARVILNPTYGFHGDKNTAIMRTRAFENQCFVAFAHPEESLVVNPKGDIVAQEVSETGGVLICDLDLSEARDNNHLADRRPELYGPIAQGYSAATRKTDDGPKLRVAAAQMLSTFDVAENTRRIVAMLEEAASQNVRVVAFPEMALAGYSKDAAFLERLDWNAVEAGVATIRKACDDLDVYAVVGAPTREGNDAYCAALTIGPDGDILDTYEKIYLAGEAWAKPGRRLTVFRIDGVECGTFVCHDERYAPLVQLRALAGAQLFFYISCESGLNALNKLNPYRAQVQARAVENGVFIVHANTPGANGSMGLADVSHGESRIVASDGNLLAEAPIYGEMLLVADLPIDRTRRGGLSAALSSGPLAAWMQQGVALVERNETPGVPEETRVLFDGTTLSGWEGSPEFFRVEEGAIVAGRLTRDIPVNHFLCTTDAYADFELTLKVRLTGDDPNAGVQFRSQRVPNSTEVCGYQADLGQHYWGCLYDESRRNRILAQAPAEVTARCVRKDDWNDYRIRCEGSRIRLWLNGELTVDYTEDDPNVARSGIIGLQIHSGAPAEAWYKDLVIRRLEAPTP